MAGHKIVRRSLGAFAMVRHSRRRIVGRKRNIDKLLRDRAITGRNYDGPQRKQGQSKLPARARLQEIHGAKQHRRERVKIHDRSKDILLTNYKTHPIGRGSPSVDSRFSTISGSEEHICGTPLMEERVMNAD